MLATALPGRLLWLFHEDLFFTALLSFQLWFWRWGLLCTFSSSRTHGAFFPGCYLYPGHHIISEMEFVMACGYAHLEKPLLCHSGFMLSSPPLYLTSVHSLCISQGPDKWCLQNMGSILMSELTVCQASRSRWFW